MAWVDHRHRHDIGGEHTPGFCKACGESGREAQHLFGEVSDEARDQQGAVVELPRLLIGHVSAETAFEVKSSEQAREKPRQDAHLLRFWIETKQHGSRKGQQRLAHQSTYRCEPGEWNPTQYSSYSPLVVMYLDEQGRFCNEVFYSRAGNPVSARAFRKSSLYAQFDDAQRAAFEQMCETARRENPRSWDRFEAASQAVADVIRDTGRDPQADEDGSWTSPDGTATIRAGFEWHLERAHELLGLQPTSGAV